MKYPRVFPVVLALFPTLALASPGTEATRALRKYNAEEQKLAQLVGPLPAPRLIAHYEQLSQVRAQIENVSTRALGESERIVLRHELATLLGSATEVEKTQGDYVEEKVAAASEQRKEDIVAIAQWANSHLDFDIKEVLGVPVLAASLVIRPQS
jgi:hypothetical protein